MRAAGFVLALCVWWGAASAPPWYWSNCATVPVWGDTVKVSPFPLTRGRVDVDFSDAGYHYVEVMLDNMPLVNVTGNKKIQFPLDRTFPAGKYRIVVHWLYGACVRAPFSLGPPLEGDVRALDEVTKSDSKERVVNDEGGKLIIDTVNEASSWKAGVNSYWDSTSLMVASRMMATGVSQLPFPFPSSDSHEPPHGSPPPGSFDARQAWPGCVGPVLDQGRCGSCWAFGAAESLSDRLCISTNGTNSTYTALSPLDLVINDDGNAGCGGGTPQNAFDFATNFGLVTEDCLPYGRWEMPHAGPIPTCTDEPCSPDTFAPTPKPRHSCANGASFHGDKRKIRKSYGLTAVDDIMADIASNGPIEAAFTVYEDFLHYKSGVYFHILGGEVGGHAVKLIGYGTEAISGLPYWLVQNSWTSAWGDQGFFKILRGHNECGIESNVVGGLW